MAQTDIAVDLGSSKIAVWKRGKGVIIKEPNLAAYDKENDRIIAFGEEARQAVQVRGGSLVAIRPVKAGMISDYSVAEAMLRYYLGKGMGRRTIRKPFVALCLPDGTTSIERRAIEEAAYQVGARDVTVVNQMTAAAVGAGLDITKPVGNLVVDIGSGTTGIAVLSLGSPVIRDNLKIGGSNFDEMITRVVRRNHHLFIDESQAEEVKLRIGQAIRRPRMETISLTGRSVTTGLSETVSLSSEEVRIGLQEQTTRIVEAIHGVLERTPPELAADIAQRGILLTGGGALLGGLEEKIREKTGINVMTAEDPELCAAVGTGLYAKMMEAMED